jgi:hypothetical protein
VCVREREREKERWGGGRKGGRERQSEREIASEKERTMAEQHFTRMLACVHACMRVYSSRVH